MGVLEDQREKWQGGQGALLEVGGSRVEVKGTCFCIEGRAFVCLSKHHQSKDILTKL